jgi:hypothetical protein
MSHIFEKDGQFHIINKNEFEDNPDFFLRGWLIAKQHPETKKDYDLMVLYSKLYLNYKIKGCTYTDDIMKKIKLVEKNNK